MRSVVSSLTGIVEQIFVCDYDTAGEEYTLLTEKPRCCDG